MSADIVSNETINCIVNGMIGYEVIDKQKAQQVGNTLFFENIQSVNYRYRENNQVPVFTFTDRCQNPYTPLQIYGCVQYWKYQTDQYTASREAPGWDKAQELLDKMLESFIGKDYPWGLD